MKKFEIGDRIEILDSMDLMALTGTIIGMEKSREMCLILFDLKDERFHSAPNIPPYYELSYNYYKLDRKSRCLFIHVSYLINISTISNRILNIEKRYIEV